MKQICGQKGRFETFHPDRFPFQQTMGVSVIFLYFGADVTEGLFPGPLQFVKNIMPLIIRNINSDFFIRKV
jgi:hypothetical protein